MTPARDFDSFLRWFEVADALEGVMQSWRDYISQETLAESVEASAPVAGAHSEPQEIDGRKVTLAVARS